MTGRRPALPRSSPVRAPRRGSRRGPLPALDVGGVAELGFELHRPVERRPAQDLRGQVVARLAAHLPHPCVGLAPAPRGRVGQVGHEGLDLRVQLRGSRGTADRAEQLAVHVELRLVPGAVAHPHRTRLPPAAQVGQLALDRSCSPPMPYMICSERSAARPPAELVANETNSSASSEQAPCRAPRWSGSSRGSRSSGSPSCAPRRRSRKGSRGHDRPGRAVSP